jgi:hypothetical protein
MESKKHWLQARTISEATLFMVRALKLAAQEALPYSDVLNLPEDKKA